MATDDIFRARLDQMIDLRHPLALLADRLPWSKVEAALESKFALESPAPRSECIGAALHLATIAREFAAWLPGSD